MNTQYRGDSAFSLTEVTLALGIAAFCLISVFGLLPVGINSNQNSLQQTAAANLAREVVSDLRDTPVSTGTNSMSSPLFGFQIPVPGKDGGVQTVYFAESANATGKMGDGPVANPSSATGIETSVSRYRVTVVFVPPASGRTSTAARIFVTWPALADKDPAIWPVSYSGSYETFTLLDRN